MFTIPTVQLSCWKTGVLNSDPGYVILDFRIGGLHPDAFKECGNREEMRTWIWISEIQSAQNNAIFLLEPESL